MNPSEKPRRSRLVPPVFKGVLATRTSLRMDEDFKTQALQSPSETLLSIRLLDFKTSLLEVIEELRIRRETENSYEDQISKIVVEKQELEWQKETLQHQMNTLHQQNKDAVAAFKKQLQARMFAMEEEKGKYQLDVETKEKEIDGLKEALKTLQMSKYTLEKKLNEMDQKLQMHLTAKEEHHKKLSEVEKCYATIACQFGVIKGVHGKLEHSVQEAIQLNKKLTSVNKRQETEISNLKEELKKVTADLIRSKVTSQYRVGEESINLAAKEKQFQELQQKISMEVAVSKKIQEENTQIKEEKLEIFNSLQCVQELLQRITQTNLRMESELNALKEEYQSLERDNELQREKAKENEEKFLNLQNEHEKALRTWKKKEENMRREIDAITNELNSLKGVHRDLEGCHPPQENRPSEQVDSLQAHSAVQPTSTDGGRSASGQEHSKDSEMQATQKENECMQSITRKDGDLEQEETEVKTKMGDSLSAEELQTEEDLQVLENSFKDEINVASPYEEKQGEASPRNTLCTDTDLITQGQPSETRVTACKEAENLGATRGMVLAENNANLEQKLQDNTEPLAAAHEHTRKVVLDSTDTVHAYRKKGTQETDSGKQELCNTADESNCAQADKFNTVQQNRGVMTPEAPQPKPETALCTEKTAACERRTDNHHAQELSFGIPSYLKENSRTECNKCRSLDSDNCVGNGLHKPENTSLNLCGLYREKLPFKQTHVDAEVRNGEDGATGRNRDDVLRTTDGPETDARDLPTMYCDNDATKEHSNNMSLSTLNLCPPKPQKGVNVDDAPSKHPDQSSTEQTGSATHPRTTNDEAVSPAKADGLEITAHEKNPTGGISTDKQILCKKVNDDMQIQSIKNGHPLEISNSTNNALLKETKDSLNSTIPGRKSAEGHRKESCSLLMITSGNLVNVSGRSSFDLSTSDKKAEESPVYLNCLDLSSCSRVNQMRGEASAPKEPSLLKGKLRCLVENTKVISKIQNLSVNVDRTEARLGSTSFNRAADTLNASSIHRDPQGEPSEGWNATAKTFYDSSFPTEHVKEGFPALQREQKSSHLPATPARRESALRAENSSSLRNSTIQNQIEEMEKILNLERLHSARKRKYEEGQ